MPLHLSLRLPLTRSWAVRPLVERGVLKDLGAELGAEWTWPLTPGELADCFTALTICKFRRGVVVRVNGEVVPAFHVEQVLRCYCQSLQVDDARAHCWVPVSGNSSLFFPCRLAGQYWRCSPEHPASLRQQVEAALVQHGCRWCPRLKLDEWELLFGSVSVSERKG